MALKVTPLGPAARMWMAVLENSGFPMRYRRMSEVDKAVTGARWAEACAWMDRRAVELAALHPEIPGDRLRGMAAAAYGYAVTPGYPSADRDEILGRMIASMEER